jgi:hypothetical protein
VVAGPATTISAMLRVMLGHQQRMVDSTSAVFLIVDTAGVIAIVSTITRPVVATLSALMQRRRNHRWVRSVAANSSRVPADGSAPSQSPAGAAVWSIAVSAIPNSERRRVRL